MLVKEKVAQAGKLLKEYGADCWITFARESQINGDPTLAFLTVSAVTWHSAFIVTSSGRSVAIVGKYDRQGIADLGAYDEVIDYVQSIKQPLQDVLRNIKPGSIAVNYSRDSEICDGLTHGMYLTLMDYLSEIGLAERVHSAEKIVSALRERKSSSEIQNIRAAIDATEDIFRQVTRFIRPGRTEKEIARFMKDQVRDRDLEFAWAEESCPAVFTGPDTAEAHYGPTDRVVEPGHVLNMDFGVKYNGYCSDLQRTFYICGKDETTAPEEVTRGFHTILHAVETAREAMRPGMKGEEIDRIARDIITGAGYPEFPHALGHQVGRFAHDGTALLGPGWEKYARKPYKTLEPGMVFTIEPRLPVPGRGIVTIEEMVVVTDSGSDWLSSPQKNLLLLPQQG